MDHSSFLSFDDLPRDMSLETSVSRGRSRMGLAESSDQPGRRKRRGALSDSRHVAIRRWDFLGYQIAL